VRSAVVTIPTSRQCHDGEAVAEQLSRGLRGSLLGLLGRILGSSPCLNRPCRCGREFWANLDGEAFGSDIERGRLP
jgi:hypothetical protein